MIAKNKYKKIVSFLIEDFERSKFNMILGAFLSLFGHPIYYIIYTYWLVQPYDNAILRFSASLSSIPLLFSLYYKDKYKPIIVIYWYSWITLILPITFTFIMLMNDNSTLWIIAETIMVFLVIIFVSNILSILVILSFGFYIGYFFFRIYGDFSPSIQMEQIIEYIMLLPLAITCGTLFLYSSKRGEFEKRKSGIFKFLAGSIAHEIRNPLNVINTIGSQISNLLQEEINGIERSKDKREYIKSKLNLKVVEKNREQILAESHDENRRLIHDYIKTRKELFELTGKIAQSIKIANNIINIILSDLGNKKVEEEDLQYFTPDIIVPRAIREYGFQSEQERNKVRFSDNLLRIADSFSNLKPRNISIIEKDRDNFVFRVEEDRFIFILFNLLKNSLYYLSQFPEATVTVGIEKNREYQNKIYNAIYVHDTGPGIKEDVMDNLFSDFYTSGKKGGTGLGLAFCRRNMNIFGGHVICESKFGEGESGWTKFSLLFPILPEEQLLKAQEFLNDNSCNQRGKILIVDDEQINLIVTKRKIEKNLNFSCDTAENGEEAVLLAKTNDYKLVLMDIQMPIMNGIEATKKIRELNKNVSVIALTSLDYEDMEEDARSYFDSYLTKPAGGHILHRTIAKYTNYKDDLSYLGEEEQYLLEIKGKSILLADDQEINRAITARKLKGLGAIIFEVKDGNELLKVYEENIILLDDKNGKKLTKSKFDIILTDINMPNLGGDEASKKIREIEVKNNIKHSNKIPIIALSGDGSEEDIKNFFKNKMTDYFIKGDKIENLIKIIAVYLNPNKIYYNREYDNLRVSSINNQHQDKISDSSSQIKESKENSLKVINLDKLRYFEENDRRSFLENFLSEASKKLADIREYVKNNDITNISISLHALKGVCGNIGAEILYKAIKDIENDIILENKPLPEDEKWLIELENCFNELRSQLRKV